MSLNINGSGGGGININGSSSSSTPAGGATTVVVDTYPPTNTSTTAVASVNCVRQVYNAIGSGGVSVLDVYPPTSTSTTSVPSARVMTNTFTLANAALSAGSSATTTANSALAATQVSASTTQAGMVQLIDSTTSTSLTLAPTANALKTVATLASMTASTTQAGIVQLIDSTTSTSLTLAPTANALKTVANSAITSTTLTTSTNFGGSATGGVIVGLSGQTLTLQSIVNPIAIQVAFSDEATAITTANMTNIRAPYSFNIRTLPLFMLYSLGTAGTTTFDIMKNGQTIYGTKPSISYVASPTNSQYTSTANAGTLLVNPTPFTQFDLIRVYVFSAGTGHLGAKCVITIS